jgi:hypothetical protein
MFLRSAPLIGTALLLVAASAGAQTLTAPTNIRRHTEETGMLPGWINRADCLADEIIRFDIRVDGAIDTSFTLQPFIGENCEDKDRRTQGANATCRALGESYTPSMSTPIELSVRQIIAGSLGTGVATIDGGTDVGAGGAGSEDPGECTGIDHPRNYKIYFMLTNSSNDEPTANYTRATWDGQIDLAGPEAPSGVTAGTGENTVLVRWTADNSTPVAEMRGFNLYCDPPAGAGPDSDAGGTTCPTDALVPNQIPSDAVRTTNFCGEALGNASSLETRPLTNGMTYAIAVAGVDTFHNVGPLSNTTCGTPKPVTGFFEAYRDAGGKAGGGFCAVGAGRSRVGAAVVAFALAAFAFRRRSRRTAGDLS